MKKSIIAAGLAAAGLVGLATPALASGTPGGTGSVAVTGNVAQACGFSSSSLGTLALGALTPGATTAMQTLAVTVQCNDAQGFTVSVTDAGAKVSQGANNVSIPSSAWLAQGTETGGSMKPLWPSDGSTPFVLDTASASTGAGGKTFTDSWALQVPSDLYYPGALTDTLTYSTFAQ